MENAFDINIVNKLGDEQKFDQLITYIDPFVKIQHPDAIAILGICYDFGYAVTQDHEKAMGLFDKSATLGSAIGQFHCGWYNFYQSANTKKGVELIRESADQGSVPAQFVLGEILRLHYEEIDNAKYYYELAANADYLLAQIKLGDLYRSLFMSQNTGYINKHKREITINNLEEHNTCRKEKILETYNQALKWLKIVGTKNNPVAQYEIAQTINDFYMWDDLMGGKRADTISCLEQAGNHTPAHFAQKIDSLWLKSRRLDRQKIEITLKNHEPFVWLNYDRKVYLIWTESDYYCIRQARSIRQARIELGLHYYKTDDAKSVYWWSKCLELDATDKYANIYLGKLKYYGCGTEQDYLGAIEHFKVVLTVDESNIEALLYLAICYYSGYGTSRDYYKAFQYFNKASFLKTKEGCLAKYYLGLCYYYGKGVQEDKEKAIEIINESANIRKRDSETPKSIEKSKRFSPKLTDAFFDEFDGYKLCGKSCFFLGYLYETGNNVPQNIVKACELYERGLKSLYTPVEMLSIRDMLMEPDLEEVLLQREIEWLEKIINPISQELKKSKTAFDSISQDQIAISNTLDKFTKELQAFVAEQKAKVSETQNIDDIDISSTSRGINNQVDAYAKNSETAQDIIEKERQWLVNYFKDNCDENWWDKLDGYTRKSLISARFFLAVSNNSHDVDYSGACISASSALENELKQRFVDGYREYLDSVSSLSFDEWPSFMVDFKGRNGSKIKRDRFSLGDSNHICDTARDIQYFKTYLDTIKRNEFADKTIYESVNTLLNLCADRSFLNSRNRAGHTETTSLNAAKKQLDTALGRLKELVWLTTNPMIK